MKFESISILSVTNTAPVLLEAYEKMGTEEFLTTLNEALESSEHLAAFDDSDLSGQLNENDAILYAGYCSIFRNAVNMLKSLPRSKAARFQLANVVAWSKAITDFRTLHEGGPAEKT